uniref:Uncharacterized protein n=1 Tax=Anguilla anguilla TaxID=7936 RepID=A0A0E9W635_ANGAN
MHRYTYRLYACSLYCKLVVVLGRFVAWKQRGPAARLRNLEWHLRWYHNFSYARKHFPPFSSYEGVSLPVVLKGEA